MTPVFDCHHCASSRGPLPRAKPRGGFVVVLVMVVVTVVTLAGLSFVLTLSTENKAAHLYGDQLQLDHAASSGAELLRAVCGQSRAERQRMGGLMDNPALFRGVAVDEREQPGRVVRFSLVSARTEDGQIVGLRYGAQNESARLNLAVLLDWEAAQPGAAQQALLSLPGMTESIADAILDWLDPDATPRPSGAEAEYYAGLALPYGPRNGVPTSLEELLLVREVSRELLFGPDVDFNHRVDPHELAAGAGGWGGADGSLPWAFLLTVYSAERNVSFDGAPRVHLNDTDLARLERASKQVFEPTWTQFIIAYRQFGPYRGTESVGEEPEAQDPFPPDRRTARRLRPKARRASMRGRIDLSLPPKFQIQSVLELVGARVQIAEPDRAGAETEQATILQSPFTPDPIQIRQYLPELVDRTTVTDDEVIRGRINVNQAPRPVLLAVPGLDETTVDQIIAARGLGADNDPERRHAIWLLTEGIVDIPRMRTLMPYLTGGGDVFRAQVVASYPSDGLSARADLVVDGTGSPPRQLYWKDMGLLGRGYSLDVIGVQQAGSSL